MENLNLKQADSFSLMQELVARMQNGDILLPADVSENAKEIERLEEENFILRGVVRNLTSEDAKKSIVKIRDSRQLLVDALWKNRMFNTTETTSLAKSFVGAVNDFLRAIGEDK